MTSRQNQYQIMTKPNSRGGWNPVVLESKPRLKAFSVEGIRTDVVLLIFAVVVLLLFGSLFTDYSSLQAGEKDLRKTSTKIEELKARVSQYREDAELSAARSGAVQEPAGDPLLIRMTVPVENADLSYYISAPDNT